MPTTSHLPTELAELARSQLGHLTIRQLADGGVPRGAVRGMVERGHLVHAFPRVLQCSGVPDTWEATAAAALLWAGSGGTLSHGSAARARGIRRVPQRASIELTVPWEHHHDLSAELRGMDGGTRIRLVRSRGFAEIDQQRIGPLRVVTLPRLLVDLAAELPVGPLLALLDELVGSRATTLSAVHERAVALRAGRAGLGPLIAATAPGAATLFRSWLERYAAALLASAGLACFEFNVAVEDGLRILAELDAYCREANLPLEFDGLAAHGAPRAQGRDRRRANMLRARQIVPLRYTYLDLLQEPETMLQQVRDALRAAGCAHLIGTPPAVPPPLPDLPGVCRRR